MSKLLKIMLFWTLVFPTIITILRIIIDLILVRDIELLSYSAVFLGMAAAGLFFAGPLYYLISKENTVPLTDSLEEKDNKTNRIS